MYTLSELLLDAAVHEEASFHLYGQAAGLNRVLPAAWLLRCYIDEAAEAFGRLTGRQGRPRRCCPDIREGFGWHLPRKPLPL